VEDAPSAAGAVNYAQWNAAGLNRFDGLTQVGLPGTLSSLGSAAGLSGYRGFATDLTAPAFGAPAVSGGSTGAPVYSDGTNWIVGANDNHLISMAA